MRAGALNTRITIQQQSTTQDALGQPVNTWTDFANCWADVRHKSGVETIKGDALTSTIKASMRVRYRADLTTGMRVSVGLLKYNIQAVLVDMQKRDYVDLVCEVVQ